MGPKDWMPSPLLRKGEILGLTTEERERLKRIDAKFRFGERYSKADQDDVGWVCLMLDRLARWRFDDYDFPKDAALINTIICTAQVMDFEARINIESVRVIEPGEFHAGVALLEWEPATTVMQAILVVRPVLYIGDSLSGRQRDEFLSGTLEITNGPFGPPGGQAYKVINPTPLEEFLMPSSDQHPRKRPFFFRAKDSSICFTAGRLEKGQAFTDEAHGIFVGNQDKIRISLQGPAPLSEPIAIRLKLVAARYSCKRQVYVEKVT